MVFPWFSHGFPHMVMDKTHGTTAEEKGACKGRPEKLHDHRGLETAEVPSRNEVSLRCI